MSTFITDHWVLSAAGVLLLEFFAILFLGLKLAISHPSDVRIVWYLFSLSCVTTTLAALWAISIDVYGSFQGYLGGNVNSILKFMLDLDTDIKVLCSALVVFVVPQACSYVLSGLYGCASAPIFVGRAVGIFVWSIVKSSVVAAGITISLAIIGNCKDWTGWSLRGTSAMIALSLMLLMSAFGGLCAYRDGTSTVTVSAMGHPSSFGQWLIGVRAWFSRNVTHRP